MKHGDYKLPGGRDLSTITFEDIRWQYGVFHCNSTGAGRDKKYFPWRGAKTKNRCFPNGKQRFMLITEITQP